MFTGLIEGLGHIVGMISKNGMIRLEIEASSIYEGVKTGDSIAVNGVCLTVAGTKGHNFIFDVMLETSRNTTLGKLKLKDQVNLERALKVGDRLGGHFVTGHIDCVGVIRSKKVSLGNVSFHIGLKPVFLKYLVCRGSVAVDGISLTIAEIKKGGFTVCIIPHTLEKTILKKKTAGDKVNVELDMLVKSVKQ
ncbi:MAG: riboflavin synthase [Candidatus Omnitrophota bacterium]